jgi:hypothetical protein
MRQNFKLVPEIPKFSESITKFIKTRWEMAMNNTKNVTTAKS